MRRPERMKIAWVRIASSVPVVNGLLKVNCVLAESTLEAMRTQGFSEEIVC